MKKAILDNAVTEGSDDNGDVVMGALEGKKQVLRRQQEKQQLKLIKEQYYNDKNKHSANTNIETSKINNSNKAGKDDINKLCDIHESEEEILDENLFITIDRSIVNFNNNDQNIKQNRPSKGSKKKNYPKRNDNK